MTECVLIFVFMMQTGLVTNNLKAGYEILRKSRQYIPLYLRAFF